MAQSTIVYIGLGSNAGERRANINSAIKALGSAETCKVLRVSDIIETKPLGDIKQGDFLNAVAEVETNLSASQLLGELLSIEKSLGRERKGKWSPRTIDLDILLFGDECIREHNLVIPHPQMHLRSFVLKGLCQLEPRFVHPVIGETMEVLAQRLNGCDFTLEGTRPQLICVAGIIGVGKTTLTSGLAKVLNGRALYEPYDTNPFLPSVYAGHKELALDSQLYFLTSRAEQLCKRNLTAGKVSVSDYIFEQEIIYARILLNSTQMSLYERVHPLVEDVVSRPVLAIYLRDEIDRCLERIHERNRPYEQVIEPAFLEKFASQYDRLFGDWKSCPQIRICPSRFSIKGQEDFIKLASEVKCYIAEGAVQE